MNLTSRDKIMIPKIIHYCWFGGNPLPLLALKCIESWKKYCPDYEIKEWNESNFDVNFNPPFVVPDLHYGAWDFRGWLAAQNSIIALGDWDTPRAYRDNPTGGLGNEGMPGTVGTLQNPGTLLWAPWGQAPGPDQTNPVRLPAQFNENPILAPLGNSPRLMLTATPIGSDVLHTLLYHRNGANLYSLQTAMEINTDLLILNRRLMWGDIDIVVTRNGTNVTTIPAQATLTWTRMSDAPSG
jgi:hypothetical protein